MIYFVTAAKDDESANENILNCAEPVKRFLHSFFSNTRNPPHSNTYHF